VKLPRQRCGRGLAELLALSSCQSLLQVLNARQLGLKLMAVSLKVSLPETLLNSRNLTPPERHLWLHRGKFLGAYALRGDRGRYRANGTRDLGEGKGTFRDR